MKSVLLFRLGGLGDLIVALPSMNLLRRALSGAAIHLVGRKDYGDLLREACVVDAVFPVEEARWASLFGDPAAIPAELGRWISNHDLVLGWFQKKEAERILRILGTHHLIPAVRLKTPVKSIELSDVSPKFSAFTYDPASGLSISRFFFDRTAESLKDLGHPAVAFEECCLLPLTDDLPRSRFAVVHSGSGSPMKCWPLDRFLAVISFLQQDGFAGALVTGEAEERWDESLRRTAFPQGWRWLRRPPLLELARLLRSSTLYFGNDSGVTHLAAACGTSVVAVFRKEWETAWRPFGRATILSAEEVDRIQLKDALAAIVRILQPGCVKNPARYGRPSSD